MGYVARLTRKGKSLVLSSGNYSISGFVPPLGQARFEFNLDISGASVGEIEADYKAIQFMLRQAGDPDNPLYFEWKSTSTVDYEPLWGQWNSFKRYEVLAGSIKLPPEYGNQRGSYLPNCRLVLDFTGDCLGNRQRAARATGGVLVDTIGVANGQARGLLIPEATTNLFNNPCFLHDTYDTAWSAASTVKMGKCNDEKFILFGHRSAILAADVNELLVESLTLTAATTYIISGYFIQRDLAAIVSTDVQGYYNGAAQTSNYEYIGDGWYRVWASVTGTGVASNTGFQIKADRILYADGLQCEQKTYPTPLCYGDMLGCSWAGTEHNSDSSRTAGRLQTVFNFLFGEAGTICITWRPDRANTAYGANAYILDTDGGLILYFDFTNDRWVLTDGTNTVNGSTHSFSAGDLIVLHVVFGPSTLKVYRNGSVDASGSIYELLTLTVFAFGSNYSGASHIGGLIKGCTIYDHAMTATQVSEDYNNILKAAENEKLIDYLLFRWGKDWDDAVDNANDSSYDNYFVAGMVPGDLEAITEIDGTVSVNLENDVAGGVVLARLDVPYGKTCKAARFYGELQGTVDANSSNGQYEQQTVGTAEVSFTRQIDMHREHLEYMGGREFYVLCRLKDDAAGNLQGAQYYRLSADSSLSSEFRSLTTGTLFFMRQLPGLVFPQLSHWLKEAEFTFPTGAGFLVKFKRTTGSAALQIDYYQIMPRPFIRIYCASSTYASGNFYYDSGKHRVGAFTSAGAWGTDKIYVEGDPLSLRPDAYNFIFQGVGDTKTNGTEAAITRTITYNRIWVTPIWLGG